MTRALLLELAGEEVGSTVEFQTSINGGVEWTVTTAEQNVIVDGVRNYRAKVVDEAGNESYSNIRRVEIDSTDPAAPVIDSQNATQIKAPTFPTFTGTGETGATVTLQADTDNDGAAPLVTIGTVTVAADGTWSITSSQDFDDGVDLSLEATQEDSAGNTSGSATGSITVDNESPAAPTIDVRPATNDTTPIISGTGEIGATVTVKADVDRDISGSTEATIGTATVETDGTWQLESNTALLDGVDVALSATQTDEAENQSSEATGDITIDTTTAAPPPVFDVLPITNNQNPTDNGYW
jgi:hypothetical protein